MMELKKEEIAALTKNAANEKILYLRYLAAREQKEALIKKYNHYIQILEQRISHLNVYEDSLL